MDDSGNKLSKQRRRRRILMHDDDEDDSTPRKIQGLIQSEPSLITFTETDKSTTSSHTERTVSSFTSVEQSKTTSISRRAFASSGEFRTRSNESFNKSESSKVESYSGFTKTESTYRSYSRTDESSSSVHKVSSSELPVRLAELSSIGNLRGAVGTDSLRPKFDQISKTDHTSRSLDSYHDFGKIIRDDRDVSIIDTGISRTYRDKSTKEGHYQTSDEMSSEHRRFKTDSEKYSYSDKGNTKVDYTRSEHHEVTERRGFVAPEEVMSLLDRNHRSGYTASKEGQSQNSYFYDPDTAQSSTKNETHSIEDLLSRGHKQSDKRKERTTFKIIPDVQSDEPEELSEMHVASIRDRVRLMRASMANQFEETEDGESDQDHEPKIDIRFSSTDDQMKKDQTLAVQGKHLMTSETETVSTDPNTVSTENGSRNILRGANQTEDISAETQTKTEHRVVSTNVNVAYEFGIPGKLNVQDTIEQDTKNNINDDLKLAASDNGGLSEGKNIHDSVEFESNEQTRKKLLDSVPDQEVKPNETNISDQMIQQNRAIAVYAEAPFGSSFSEQESSKFLTGIKIMETNSNYKGEDQEQDRAHSVDKMEIVQNTYDKKDNVLESEMLLATLNATEEKADIEREAPAKTADSSSNFAELAADHRNGKHFIISDISKTTTIKSLYEIQPMEVETGYKTSKMPTDTDNDLADKELDLTDGKQITVTSVDGTYPGTPQSEDEVKLKGIKQPALYNDTGDVLTFAGQNELTKELEPSKVETDTAELSNLNETSSLSIQQTDTGNVSDEIITIQTGIVTSVEPSADSAGSKQLGIPKKTVGSDEVIIIHGVPMRKSYDTQFYNTLQHNTGADEKKGNSSEEFERHEIRSTEVTKSLKFERSKLNLRSYAPKPYQKVQVKPRESAQPRQPSPEIQSREIRSTYLQFKEKPAYVETDKMSEGTRQPLGAQPNIYDDKEEQDKLMLHEPSPTEVQSNNNLQLHTQHHDLATGKKSDDLVQPAETSLYQERPDVHDSPMERENTVEQLMSYETSTTEAQSIDNLQSYTQRFDVAPEEETDDVEQPNEASLNEDHLDVYDSLQDEQVKVEQMSDETSTTEAQSNDDLQPSTQPAGAAPKKKFDNVEQPNKTSPYEYHSDAYDSSKDEEGTDESMSYKPTNIQLNDNLQRYSLPPDVGLEAKAEDAWPPDTPPHDEEPNEFMSYDLHQLQKRTLPTCEQALDLRDGTENVWQSFETPPHDDEQNEFILQTEIKLEDEHDKKEAESTEEQPNENGQPIYPKPPGPLPVNTSENVDQPYETQPHDEPNKLRSHDPLPAEVEPQDEQLKKITAVDWCNTEHYKYDDEEMHGSRSYQTPSFESRPYKNPAVDLQPQNDKDDVQYHTEKYNARKGNGPSRRHKPDGMRQDSPLQDVDPEKMALDETDGGYERESFRMQTDETSPYEVIPSDNKETDTAPHLTPRDITLNTTHTLEFQPDESSPFESKTLKILESELEKPDIRQYKSAWHPAAEDLEPKSQPMDTEFENQSSVITTQEVVTSEETTIRELYSENIRTKYTPQYIDKDPVLNQSFSDVQLEQVTLEENRLEPVYAEPNADVSFEQILVLDDLPEKLGSSYRTNSKKIPVDPENFNIQHSTKYEIREIMKTEDEPCEKPKEEPFGDIGKDIEPYNVEKREVRKHETIPYELRANDMQRRKSPTYTPEPIEEQLGDKKDDKTADLPDAETCDVQRREIRSFKTTSDESQRYEVEKTELKSYKLQLYELESKDKKYDVASDDHLYNTESYNVQKRELRPYKTSSYKSQPYELHPPGLESFKTWSYEIEPKDKQDDATSDDHMHPTEVHSIQKHELRSYRTTSYESQQYETEPSALQSLQSSPYETQAQNSESDVTVDERLHNTEALEANRRCDTTSYESFQHDMQPVELHGQEQEMYEPSKHAPTLDSDDYFVKNNIPVDSNLHSPSRKRKFPDSYEEPQDHDLDASSAPPVAIIRKVRVTTSNRFPTAEKPDARTTESKSIKVPLTSENKSSMDEVVEKISASRKSVLESMEEGVDQVFNLMEYETADNKKHISQNEPPQSEDGLNQSRDTDLQMPIPDQTPLRKYRVDCHIQLSPFERPESKKLTKAWKSEPILNLDSTDDEHRSKPRRWKSMNFEKKLLKQSSVAIELQKPQRRPLMPAYSVDKLPFETIIRNEVNIKLKKKRSKSFPSNTMKVPDSGVPNEPTSASEIQPREIQTEEIDREHVQLSESYETVDAFFEDDFEDESEEMPANNKENEHKYDEPMESFVQSPLKRRNVSTNFTKLFKPSFYLIATVLSIL